MEGDRIAEVRGVAHDQNLDPEIAGSTIIQDKLKEFGAEGEKYQKRDSDMRRLTQIEYKNKNKEELTPEDLRFLYEIDEKIEGFGHDERDTQRVQEIISARNPKEDAPVVFECKPEEIAWQESEVNEKTKVYIGLLFKGIFTEYPNIEHIYTSFPEGEVKRWELEIGGKTVEQLEQEMKEKDINISDYAQDMLHSPEFNTLPNPENIRLVRVTVKDFGLKNRATTQEIYNRAKELGLKLCPAETAPHQRLQDLDQTSDDWYFIATKPIDDRFVFDLRCYVDAGLWLSSDGAYPDDGWLSDYRFVFSSV
jgi:hypothetical protein